MPLALFACCCCRGGERPRRPRREHRRRRHRRQHQLTGAAPSRASTHRADLLSSPPSGRAGSVASDNEYHDAREAFSQTDGDISPLSSTPVSPRGHEQLQEDPYCDEFESGSGSDSGSEASQSSTGFGVRLVGCLTIMRASSMGEEDHHPRALHHVGRLSGHFRLPVGCTFPRRQPSDSPGIAHGCWDECESTTYQIRSTDYMRTKVKQPSSKAIYRLVAMDLFSTETKAYHIAKHFSLPQTGPPVVCKAVGGGPEVVLPPLLIMNVQLPDYPAAIWGANDGPGQSIVYYLALSDDFDPERFENPAALGLLQRFVTNGREADGSPTRDRLKMIPRVANLEEWARMAPLNNTEYKLLLNYNEKPVLTRPQQAFHMGPNYLEVDLDVHSYAFLARKALWSYHDRLRTVVWENAFVIQGNSPDELPEQLLGCGRIYRSDFRRFRFLSEFVSELSASASAAATPSLASYPPTPNGTRTPSSRPGTAQGERKESTAAGAEADAAVVVNGGDSPPGPVGGASGSAPSPAAAAAAADDDPRELGSEAGQEKGAAGAGAATGAGTAVPEAAAAAVGAAEPSPSPAAAVAAAADAQQSSTES